MYRKIAYLLLLAMLVSTLVGCVTMTDWRQEYIDAHPELDKRTALAIEHGRIFRGMTREEVRASWGPPLDINRSVGSWGVREQWVYGDARYTKPRYVYFKGGRCSGWQR
ncbi:MAG: hypothetical protein GF393_10650 [Armatimonadia bacterium]|nr:hypothetical protein [Armatimonadia bacterium]